MIIASDLEIIRRLNPVTVIIVSEELSPEVEAHLQEISSRSYTQVYRLPQLLPSATFVRNKLDNLESGMNETTAQYQFEYEYDNYLKKDPTFAKLFLFAGCNDRLMSTLVVLNDEDMTNKDFPFVQVLLRYILQAISGDHIEQYSPYVYEIKVNDLSIWTCISHIIMNHLIDDSSLIHIIQKTRSIPNTGRIKILQSYGYDVSLDEVSNNIHKYRYVLQDILYAMYNNIPYSRNAVVKSRLGRRIF